MKAIELNNTHVDKVAKLHELAFKGFFLTQLGTSFLKCYYKSVVKSPKAMNIGIIDQSNNLIGFAVTAKHSKGFNRSIVKEDFFRFLPVVIKILATKPLAIYRLYKNLDKKSVEILEDKGNYCELLSIGTHPEKQGMGIGKKLIIETEKKLKKEGYKKLALTTDYKDNDSVIRFYEKNGYTKYYQFNTYPRRKMYKLIKNL